MTGKPVLRPLFGTADQRRTLAMRTISIVVPVKDERDNVEPLYAAVKDALREASPGESSTLMTAAPTAPTRNSRASRR